MTLAPPGTAHLRPTAPALANQSLTENDGPVPLRRSAYQRQGPGQATAGAAEPSTSTLLSAAPRYHIRKDADMPEKNFPD